MSYGPKPKILVVEDEYAMQIVLRDYLEGDYELTLADNGRQANKHIKTTVFKAALIDLNLPDINGVEIIKALHAKSSRTAVIVLTGDMSEEAVKSVIKAGADDYLVKPVKKPILLERLTRACLKKIMDE